MKSTATLRSSIQNKTRSLSRLVGILTRRLFLLTLVSFVAVAALLGIAASANKANRAAKARAEQAANTKSAISPGVQNGKQPLAPTAAVITATLSDNVTPATKVAPGGTINYTAIISNTAPVGAGNDASSVQYSATLDSNTTFVNNSAHASPLAIGETYTTVGNTLLEAGVAPSGNPAVTSAVTLFTNDTIATAPDTIQLVSFTATSANGGTVSVNADGSFTYLPPVGFTGSDTFSYTIRNNTDATLTDTGTVTVTVGAPRVWYVNNSGANGDGRSTSPFNTLANAAAVDAAGDIIYIFTGAGNYTGGITLLNNEQVIGNGVALVVNTFTLRAAGSRPTVVNAGGNGMTLGLNNTLTGFNFGACTGFAIQGASVGTLAVNNMLINNTSGGALDLTGVTTPTVNVVLDSTTSTGGTNNVRLVGLNGTVTLGSGALSGSTAGAANHAFSNSGGNAGITFSGSITKANQGNVVNIASRTAGTVTLSGQISGSGSNGINVSNNTGGTIDFTNGTKTLNTAANAAVTLATNTGTTINFTNGGLDIDTTGGAGFTATGGGTVTVTTGGNPNTIDSTTGTALNVANTTIGAGGLTFRSISANGAANGIVLNTTGASGSLVVTGNAGTCTSAATCTGGAIQNTTGDAISLTSTQSPSFTFMFITNTGGQGINVSSLTAGLTLTSSTVSNTGDGDNEHAMKLLNVSGTVAIQGTSFNNTAEDFLNIDTTSVSPNNADMILNIGTVTACTFTQPNTIAAIRAAGAFAGNGILVTQRFSKNYTFNISNTILTDIKLFGMQFGSSGGPGGTASTSTNCNVNLNNNQFQVTITNALGNPNNRANTINIQGQNTLDIDASITNNVLNKGGGGGIQLGADQSSNISANITGNTVTNQFADGILIGVDENATMTLLIDSNTITNTSSDGMEIANAISPGGVSTLNATITNNTVTTTNTNVGANAFFAGIGVFGGVEAADVTFVNVTGNTVGGSPASSFDYALDGSSFGDQIILQGPGSAAVAEADFLAAPPPQNTANSAPGLKTFIGNTFYSNGATVPLPVLTLISNPADDSVRNRINEVIDNYPAANAMVHTDAEMAKTPVTVMPVPQVSSKAGISSVLAKATPKASAAEVARTYRREARLSHHAIRSSFNPSPSQNAPLANLPVTIGTLPAQKSVTIKYQVTVNAPPPARSVSSQGTVTGNGPGAFSVQTDDTDLPGGPADPTITLVDTLMTWNGSTNTDWNTATNWTPPAGGTQYAPGVSNPAVNDVVIPAVATQPNIGTSNIGVFSLSLANTMTLTITNPFNLTIGSPAPGVGGDLTLNGVITGGFLNFGTGSHNITNAGGTGSLSATNVATVLSGSTVTLANDLQAGALAVNAGGSMTIAGRTLSLNGSGAALVVPGGATFTTTTSTVIFNGTAAQTAAGIAYNNLTINNTIGLNVTGVTLTGNATVNGVLALTSSDLVTGAFTLSQPNTTASTGVSDVVGTITRTAAFGTTTITFGNPNNQITFGAAGTKPTSLTVVMAKAAPATYAAAVLRNYTISQAGTNTATATVRLHYLDSELNGNLPETALGLRRLRTGDGHWVAAPPPPGVPNRDGSANWVEAPAAPGVSGTDLPTQWTFSTLVPTAANGIVTGRIVDDNGVAVEGAVVRLGGTQNRKFITDANGFYRFDNVETAGFYTVTPSRVNYQFSPTLRSFSQIGETTNAGFGATRTDGTENPLDTPEYFVRQHYIDFLGREPDEAGFNFWSDQILECGFDQNCIERRRENVSAAYFLSIEFQQTGGLVDGLYRASYGTQPQFGAFMPDTRAVGLGVQVGQEGWEAKLAANKESFTNAFVNRPTFVGVYGNMDNSLFVDTLIGNTGVSFTAGERDALVSSLTTGGASRAEVLRSIAENQRFVNAKFNEAFVMMEYFGYLRRDPDAGGYAFWLNKLSEFNGNFERAEMVKAFIVSGEFRDRFPR